MLPDKFLPIILSNTGVSILDTSSIRGEDALPSILILPESKPVITPQLC